MKKFDKVLYESFIKNLCGSNWRMLPEREQDAAWGMLVVKAIINGVDPDLHAVSHHLGVKSEWIEVPFHNLYMNGAFNKCKKDRALRKDDVTAWSYYGGYACGMTGPYVATFYDQFN